MVFPGGKGWCAGQVLIPSTSFGHQWVARRGGEIGPATQDGEGFLPVYEGGGHIFLRDQRGDRSRAAESPPK